MIERLKRNSLIRAAVKPIYDATIRRILNAYRYWIFRNEKKLPPPDPALKMSFFSVERDGRIRIWGESGDEFDFPELPARFPETDYFVLLETGAVFSRRARAGLSRAILNHPDAELIYSDADHLSASGKRTDPWFKPDFNLYSFRQENLLRPLCVVQRHLIERMNALKIEPYNWTEAAFRLVESARSVVHIPEIFAHELPDFDSGAPERIAAENSALRSHLERQNVAAAVIPLRRYPRRRVRYALTKKPLVSILIPNKDQRAMLARCVDSIRSKTTYPNYEIIIIENNSVSGEIETFYAELQNDASFPGRIVRYPDSFNYSLINNWGAERSEGELLLFLNNDTEILSPGWLEELVSLAIQEDVGAVGAKLLFPDRKIQHAGISYASFAERWLFHVQEGMEESAPGYYGATRKVTPVLAVTGACLMIRRELFVNLGGFPGDLPIVYNDVELCFKAVERGLTNLMTPFARLIHYESATRGSSLTEAQIAKIRQDFQTLMNRYPRIRDAQDPYFSKNLTFDHYFQEKIS